MITRRALVLTVAAIAQHGQRPALAAEGPPVAAAAAEFPLVTSRASLMITIGNKPPQEMLVGLYGDTSPSSVALFKGLCAGTLPSVEFQSTLSYAGSTASRIEKDRVIVLGKLGAGTAQYIERSIDGTGYVRSELVNRADSFNTTDDGAAGFLPLPLTNPNPNPNPNLNPYPNPHPNPNPNPKPNPNPHQAGRSCCTTGAVSSPCGVVAARSSLRSRRGQTARSTQSGLSSARCV